MWTPSIEGARFFHELIEAAQPAGRAAGEHGLERRRHSRGDGIWPSRKAVGRGHGAFFVEKINAVHREQHLAQAGNAAEAATHHVGRVPKPAPVTGVLQGKLRLPEKRVDETNACGCPG